MKSKLSLLFFIFSNFCIYAQENTISGYVVNCQSNERLIGALLYTKDSKVIAETNEYGYFNVLMPTSYDSLHISYLGFKKKAILISQINEEICLNENLQMDEVIIKGKHEMNALVAQNKLNLQLLTAVPSLGSETDILKNITILPGVTTGIEGSSDYFVRGGSSDQNLIMLDGVPVFNINHLGGYFSQVNADVINSAQFYKGNMPANYGGRLSSLLDISIKSGNQDSLKGKFGLGLITSKLYLEGPTFIKNSSFLLASRASYLGIVNLFRNINKKDRFNYWLYDINAKFHMDIGKGKLDFSFFKGQDIGMSKSLEEKKSEQTYYYSLTEFLTMWGNDVLSIKYGKPISSNLFLTALVGYSKYKNSNIESSYVKEIQIDTSIRNSLFENKSNVHSWNYQLYFDVGAFRNHLIKTGVQGAFYKGNIKTITRSSNLVNDHAYTFHELGTFINDKFQYKNFGINVGLRISHYISEGKYSGILEPRLETSLSFQKFRVFGGYHRNSQFHQLIQIDEDGFRKNYWVRTPKNNPPSISNQVYLGVKSNFNNGFMIHMEAFYKTYSHLIQFFQKNEEKLNLSEWEKNVHTNGTGKSKGIELQMSYSTQKTDVSLNYTLSNSTRTFANINGGKEFTYTYDKTHDVNIILNQQVNRNLSIFCSWVFQTGNALTLPTGRIVLPDGYSDLLFENYNNARMPNYHKLDVGLQYKKKTKYGNTRLWTFSIYNVYNRKNPNFLRIGSKVILDENQQFLYHIYKPELISYFGILPSLSYSYEF